MNVTEEFNLGWEEGRASMEVEVGQLRAEIEQLRFQNKNLMEMNRQLRDRQAEWAAKWNQACGERDALAFQLQELGQQP